MPEIALHNLVTIQVGYQAKARIEENPRGTHRIIQSKDFDAFHRLLPENLTAFFPERKPEIYTVHKGDILLLARGIEHFAYCIEHDLQDTLAAGSFYILRTQTASLLPEYLAWWLNQPRARAFFQTHAGRTGISFLSKSALNGLHVPIPPISVQKKVIKLVRLARHEQCLLHRLSTLRAQLVQTLCQKTVQEQEK